MKYACPDNLRRENGLEAASKQAYVLNTRVLGQRKREAVKNVMSLLFEVRQNSPKVVIMLFQKHGTRLFITQSTEGVTLFLHILNLF